MPGCQQKSNKRLEQDKHLCVFMGVGLCVCVCARSLASLAVRCRYRRLVERPPLSSIIESTKPAGITGRAPPLDTIAQIDFYYPVLGIPLHPTPSLSSLGLCHKKKKKKTSCDILRFLANFLLICTASKQNINSSVHKHLIYCPGPGHPPIVVRHVASAAPLPNSPGSPGHPLPLSPPPLFSQ